MYLGIEFEYLLFCRVFDVWGYLGLGVIVYVSIKMLVILFEYVKLLIYEFLN